MWGTGDFAEAGGDRVAEKTFARDGGKQGEAEGVELGEAGEQGIVLVEILAEAEAGVEDDGVASDARRKRSGNPVAKLLADQGDDVRIGRQRAPLVRRPRTCIRMEPQGLAAMVAAMAESQVKPLTSLTISAPASRAQRATADL